VVGRDEVITALAAEATRRRLLSLVGPGGIGKTTVAVAVADRLRAAFHAVAFVDLAPIENGTQMSQPPLPLSGSIFVSRRIRSTK
jgi:predicted ATPase